MTEFAKSFFMMVGTITTALVLTYFMLKLEEKFKSWRKMVAKSSVYANMNMMLNLQTAYLVKYH